MAMGIVSKVLMTTVDEGTLNFSPNHCLNRRQTKHPCRVCSQLCPGHAIPSNPVTTRIEWTKCINCGLCVTACPGRCFSLDAKHQQAISAPENANGIIFACAHSDVPATLQKVECLCGIPWEWLAALAMRMQVRLYVGSCETCNLTACREQLAENLMHLELFLGEKRFEQQVLLADDADEIKERQAAESMNRRQALNIFRRKVTKTMAVSVASMMPKTESDPSKDAFAYRKLLSNMIAADCIARRKKSKEENIPAQYPEYGILLPDFNTNCYACGMCEKVCPQKALTIKQDVPGESMISISPWKCTACGLCAATCLVNGISGIAPHQLLHLEEQRFVHVHHDCCSICGIPIDHNAEDGMCIACGIKNKSKRRK